MKRILTAISPHIKWLWLIPYFFIAVIGWFNRANIWKYIPIKSDSAVFPIFKLAFDVLYILIGALLLSGIIKLIQAPPLAWWRFQRTVTRTGLYNDRQEYPVLRSVRPDKDKQHGKILEIKNVGLSVADFEAAAPRLGAALGGKIYRIAYGRKTAYIRLYVLPHKYDIPSVISVDSERLCKEPNCLVVGKTGSGKSYALLTLLGIYAQHISDCSITICDYKKSSFSEFADTPNFYGYEDVPDGIRTFYKEFSERLAANDEERNKKIRILLIDEYGALISAQDKKAADELRTMVANLLFMGRSLGLRVLIGVQRADSEHFKNGARDQFRSIMSLGDLSKEQKSMLFTDYKDEMNEHNALGEGYLLIDGQLERVRVAKIRDMDVLNDSIRKAMCR